MSYDLVIFDWDGTVMDSTARIVACMHGAARDLALPALEDEQVRGIIGLGLPEAILTLYPFLDEAMVSTMRDRYAHHFVLAERAPSVPYPGARDTLLALRERGMRLAVATGKSRKGWTGSGPTPASGRCFTPPAAPTRAAPNRIRPWCWSCWRN